MHTSQHAARLFAPAVPFVVVPVLTSVGAPIAIGSASELGGSRIEKPEGGPDRPKIAFWRTPLGATLATLEIRRSFSVRATRRF